MATVTMPQLGESVTEGTILHWLKQPGDPVALDDSLCEIETEKVTAELPSPYEGTMGEILVPEGETVKVNVALCEVLEGAVTASRPAARHTGAWSGGPMAIPVDREDMAAGEPGPHPPARRTAQPNGAATPGETAARLAPGRARFYSPVVLQLAEEHGIDLGSIRGSGIGGRVTRKDVEAAIANGAALAAVRSAGSAPAVPRATPAAAATGPTTPFEVVELSPTRRAIAENLSRSNREAPQAWTMVEVDVTELARLREREKERLATRDGGSLTLLAYFTAAVCEALREFPMLNARWEGAELRRYNDINIGIAVAAEQGLVVPVIHRAGQLSVPGLASAIADVTQRGRDHKLRIQDIEGGTFTVDNTGAFGSIASRPLVNHPEVAIVTMERIQKRPVVVGDDAIAVRSMMNVCLSFDHRALDGAEAGAFLAALKRRLETWS